MNAIILGIVALFSLGSIGSFGFSNYDASLTCNKFFCNESLRFGATNFPTSLDSLTNPGATDSVATVSHSAQHSNANDAIEALEAKLGIGASTALVDTIFVGDGTGTSRYSTYATTTNLSTTGVQTTTLLATGSTTLQNFTFVNATGSSATTTNFFTTTASSTNQFSGTASTSALYGAGLASCSGNNFLQWSNGAFTCASSSGASFATVSTTSAQDLATTTLRSIPSGEHLRFVFNLATTSNQSLRVCFNEDWGGCKQTTPYYGSRNTTDGGASSALDDKTYATISMGGAGTQSAQMYGAFDIFNSTTSQKLMLGQATQELVLTNNSPDTLTEVAINWSSTTAAINSISLVTEEPALLIGAGSIMTVYVLDP